MKWINALSLLFQFLAFWFAAPELLGEKTLKRFESGLQKMITHLPIIILMVIILGFSVSYAVYGIYTGLKATEEGISTNEMIQYFIVMFISFIIYGVFLYFNKRIIKKLDNHLAQPLLQKLIYRSEVRKNALIVGALLFTLGFIIQFTIALI